MSTTTSNPRSSAAWAQVLGEIELALAEVKAATAGMEKTIQDLAAPVPAVQTAAGWLRQLDQHDDAVAGLSQVARRTDALVNQAVEALSAGEAAQQGCLARAAEARRTLADWDAKMSDHESVHVKRSTFASDNEPSTLPQREA